MQVTQIEPATFLVNSTRFDRLLEVAQPVAHLVMHTPRTQR
jgi:hypothetical protein